MTCLLMANHKEATLGVGGSRIELKPGDFLTSIPSLATASGLSERQVRTAQDNLKNLDFLTWKLTGFGRVVSIINWGSYQLAEKEHDREVDRPLTGERQGVDSKQEGKKVKNVNKGEKKHSPESDKLFKEFWDNYPKPDRRSVKSKTKELFLKLIEDGKNPHDLIRAAKNYAEDKDSIKDDGKYVVGSQVFLGPQRKWEPFVEDNVAAPPKVTAYQPSKADLKAVERK